jgi:hypothetical protein
VNKTRIPFRNQWIFGLCLSLSISIVIIERQKKERKNTPLYLANGPVCMPSKVVLTF